MNFLLDHDVPERIAAVLRQEGHTIVTLRHALHIEASDQDVLRHAFESKLVVVTCNRNDFLTLAKTQQHYGIIILIRRPTRIAECAAILRLLRNAAKSGLEGNINFA